MNVILECEKSTINNHGEIIASYRKIHLFGNNICYDLHFPELFRSFALDGAQIIVLPAGQIGSYPSNVL